MKKMGIEALYQHPKNPVFPCLQRRLDITRANQVWDMDITYLPMRKGFVYLAAVLDAATRRARSWRLADQQKREAVSEQRPAERLLVIPIVPRAR